MKVLIVCSGNTNSVFVDDQVRALRLLGITIDYFYIRKKGLFGYLSCRKPYLDKIASFHPDLIHAHFGLAGVLANLQRKAPVVTTYHGSDINHVLLRLLSFPALLLSEYHIFVSHKQYAKIEWFIKKSYSIIPCGINLDIFKPIYKFEARRELNWDTEKKYVLFSSDFDIPIKNAALAKKAVSLLKNVELIELKGYTQQEVNLVMNACDVGLMTSFSEGSPMFVKELLAINKPVVSTNIGDVAERIDGVDGCFLTTFDPEDIAQKLTNALTYTFVDSRNKMKSLGNEYIAESIKSIYEKIVPICVESAE